MDDRSTLSQLTSSFLVLTTLLLILGSPVAAAVDTSIVCNVAQVDAVSHSTSHFFVLGRRARWDKISEITLDRRAAPHPERPQNGDDDKKNQPSDSSDDSKSQKNNPGNGGKGDKPPVDPSSDSDASADDDEKSNTGETDPSPSTTTCTDDKSSITTTSTAGGGTVTVTASTSAVDEIQTASAVGPDSPLPTFDANLGNNFTSPDCPGFFADLVKNSTFTDCHPVSLLLRNSKSFFDITKSAALVSQALDASCAVDESSCKDLMFSLASQLTDDSTCGQEYEDGNQVVRGAYAGLVSYEPIYRATCLKSPTTNGYCFANAITNDSNPVDSYVYSLPLGYAIPPGSRLTCNRCLQATIEIFADAALVEGQPLTETYVDGAEQINMGCGPDFANTTVQVGTLPAINAAPSDLTRPNSILTVYASFLSVSALLYLY